MLPLHEMVELREFDGTSIDLFASILFRIRLDS